MIKKDKEEITQQIIEIGNKIHPLVTSENQDDVYSIIEDLNNLQDKIFNL